MRGRAAAWLAAWAGVALAVAPADARREQTPPGATIRGRLAIRRLATAPQPRPGVADHGGVPGRGVADVRRGLVYLDTAPRGAFDEPEPGRAVMDQRDETFVPRLLGVTTGTVVDFPNSDRTYHNVFSLSRAKRFDLGRYASGRSKAVRFDRPGVVRVFCDIHSHMSAFVVVFTHPFFRVTDADGRYRLDNVPPGTYTVVGWYEGEARAQRSVSVAAGATVELDLEVPVIPGLASLRTRIFVASTLLATASIGAAVYFVSVRLTAQAEAELQRDLVEAAGLVDQQSASLFDSFTRTATLIADLPKFKAAVETRDGPTIEPIARDYLRQAGADLVIVADRSGQRLAAVTAPSRPASLPEPSALTDVVDGQPRTAFWPHPNGVLQVVTVPVTIDLERPELLGALTMGYLLDAERAGALKALTGAEVAFAYDGTVRASSLPIDISAAVGPWIHADQHVPRLAIGDEDYSALVLPMAAAQAPASPAGEPPRAVVLRSRTARMQTLGTIRTALAGIALATVALAAVLSYAIARTVTKPLATITAHMREVAATGDLTRKVSLPPTAWNDEDATVMAATFNALTESVAASQRDAAQRERLSALGRLSTVIAHEIRNPLMIIKGALRPLLRAEGSADDRRDAAHDINGEVDRLNRVVNEVLDFARPIRFDLAAADVNDVCRSARDAVLAAAPTPDVALALDPACGSLVTDAERVRTVLVNLLTNARAAVADPDGGDGAPVVISTSRVGPSRVAIVVRDRGVGIPGDDLGRVFDPYFTTRRTGSGLGLAIAKNVVEGLGGAITATSTVGAGTELRVELPDLTESDRRR